MAIDFPNSPSNNEQYTDSASGLVYTYNASKGVWETTFTPNAEADTRYLRLDAGAGEQTVQSTDTTTFDGLVEAGGGVSVSGTSSTTSQSGITTHRGIHADTPNFGTQRRLGIQVTSRSDNNLDTYNAFDSYYGASAGTTANITHFYASQDANNTYGTVKGFEANGNLVNGTVATYGFYSNLDTNTGPANYNFYAEGDAPNFLQGDTYIGGTTSRNTRELWESTLTEEQKQQLAAGTLTVPANVSTPGDGSFARQWWYDQQSSEDQALIDSGELEYPEHFQAANFVDTFDIDKGTRIHLLSDGDAVFKDKLFNGNPSGRDTIWTFSQNVTPRFQIEGSLSNSAHLLITRASATEFGGYVNLS